MKECSVLLLLLAACVLGSAIPKSDEHVKKPHVSEHDHYDEGGHHNSEYDHDAFLGEEEAREFDKLDPEESKRRLGLIYDKIDINKEDGAPGDGKVDKDELLKWIQHVQKKYLENDAKRQWDELAHTGDKLSWEHYREKSYGGLDHPEDSDKEEFAEAVKMERRDKRRFERADKNSDGFLDQQEFAEFIHPEESVNMRDLVVEETLEDIDKDGDGYISMEEYIGDMWDPSEGAEPDWVDRERKNFKEQRDTNQDGRLDKEEVAAWILPEDSDHMEVEAKHLMREADTDKDGFLTKEEVLAKHDVFAGSQATDYGDAIARHDEF